MEIPKKIMRKIGLIFFTFAIAVGCAKRIDLLKTGTLKNRNYYDTISIAKNRFIVLPTKVDGIDRNLIFDTGADFVILPKDSTKSNIKIELKDSNNKKIIVSANKLNKFYFSKIGISDLYAINMDMSKPLLCFANGIFGNNVIKASNWIIEDNQIIITNKKVFLKEKKLDLKFYYFDSNRLHSNILLNGIRIDTCLIDYGGAFDIMLPISYFDKYQNDFQINYSDYQMSSSWGVNGKGPIDSVLNVNCNINFNGIKIDSVNISFRKKSEKRIGLVFLKRFGQVAINSNNSTISFGALKEQKQVARKRLIYNFDLIDSCFVIDSKIITNDSMLLFLGDKFTVLNNKKANSFNSYCDFLSWKNSLQKEEYLDIETIEGKRFKIKNWR